MLNYIFDKDGLYEKLADKLIENQPWIRRATRGHWLCKQLAAAARGLDPGTYAEQVGKSVRDGLRGLGLPAFMTNALGAGSGVALKIVFGHTPLATLPKALRVLIPLVCPNMNRCPTEVEVIQTLLSPALADRLKEIAGG